MPEPHRPWGRWCENSVVLIRAQLLLSPVRSLCKVVWIVLSHAGSLMVSGLRVSVLIHMSIFRACFESEGLCLMRRCSLAYELAKGCSVHGGGM